MTSRTFTVIVVFKMHASLVSTSLVTSTCNCWLRVLFSFILCNNVLFLSSSHHYFAFIVLSDFIISCRSSTHIELTYNVNWPILMMACISTLIYVVSNNLVLRKPHLCK
ncbi:unnamed protein product [Musa textilis]